MFGFKNVRSSARSGFSRVAVSAFLALWCVLALGSGDARAICLDLGGDCSPSAAVPEEPCHDQVPDGGENPSCDSCVDILVHEEASARGSQPEHELRAPAAAHPSGRASDALLAAAETVAASALPLIDGSSLYPALRTAVLRI
jgi:hypothetical protein